MIRWGGARGRETKVRAPHLIEAILSTKCNAISFVTSRLLQDLSGPLAQAHPTWTYSTQSATFMKVIKSHRLIDRLMRGRAALSNVWGKTTIIAFIKYHCQGAFFRPHVGSGAPYL